MFDYLQKKPCILCVALTGSVPTKQNNPSLPVTISEQIESAHECFEVGATVAHCHVRNEDQTPTSDADRFSRLKEGLEKYCPGMIVQFSTGGRAGSGRERGQMLSLKPEMASLAVGSNNFPNRVYDNSPDLINWLAKEMLNYNVLPEVEAFDLSHIFQAAQMVSDGRLIRPPYIQFVMGIKNAMPADMEVFKFYIKTVQRILPGSEWCGAGIGKFQLVVNEWSIRMGGHTRTGMEDNIRLDKNTLAPSNAALVLKAVELCAKYDRPVASCKQARKILNLKYFDET